MLAKQADSIRELTDEVNDLKRQLKDLEANMEDKITKKYKELETEFKEQRMDLEDERDKAQEDFRHLASATHNQQSQIRLAQEKEDKLLVGQLKYAFEAHVLAQYAFSPEFGEFAPKTFSEANGMFDEDWSKWAKEGDFFFPILSAIMPLFTIILTLYHS